MNWYKKIIYAGIEVFTFRQITKKLKRLGYVFIRYGKGDHQIWGTPDGNVTGSFQAVREPNPSTVRRAVTVELGLPWQTFVQA